MLSPLLHGRLDEGEPSVAEALGERRPGFRQHMTDARGVALERQLLEPVELFPGQPQHRGQQMHWIDLVLRRHIRFLCGVFDHSDRFGAEWRFS